MSTQESATKVFPMEETAIVTSNKLSRRVFQFGLYVSCKLKDNIHRSVTHVNLVIDNVYLPFMVIPRVNNKVTQMTASISNVTAEAI